MALIERNVRGLTASGDDLTDSSVFASFSIESALASVSDNTNNNAATRPVIAYAPTLVCSKKSLLALLYSVLDAARHPSPLRLLHTE